MSRLTPAAVAITVVLVAILVYAQTGGSPASPAAGAATSSAAPTSAAVSGCSGCAVPAPAATSGGTAYEANRSSLHPQLFLGQIMVYATHGFSAAQVASVRAHIHAPVVAVTSSEQLFASGKSGYPYVDVDTMLADPYAYAAAAGVPALAAEMAAGVVLATEEARLRGARTGSTIALANGKSVRVTAVVEAHQIGGHEMATSPSILHAAAGNDPDYLLVGGSLTAATVTAAAHAALPGLAVRVRSRTANGYLSSADTVLTQLQTKVQFGEFAFRPAAASTSGIIQDPGWVQTHLQSKQVVQLGPVTCNRAIMAPLAAAMAEVTARGLGSMINTADFQYEGGCWSPRVTRAISGGVLSSHSWGLAIDINVVNNPLGGSPHQDPRLVSIMAAHGFAWGGRFLRPDPAHFQWVGTIPH
ncbi:MAG: hypothetical protein QOJ11_955 [Frankiales bacterium]|jgi:hypothetical protein|nr:hypothetical protein [Frankiales bacterium]